MKKSIAPTLSSHLLREAGKYNLYPARVDRKLPWNVWDNPVWDKLVRKVVERRMTFHRGPEDELTPLIQPALLNQFYCWDLLKAIPAIVERTVKLSHVTLSGMSDSDFVYLREAAKCYILGLPEAAVALARAALEDCLRKKLAKMYGKATVAETDLKEWIDDLARTKDLSREGRTSAHRVRVAGNEVLHPDHQVTAPPDPLGVIEATRAVVLELSGR